MKKATAKLVRVMVFGAAILGLNASFAGAVAPGSPGPKPILPPGCYIVICDANTCVAIQFPC